MLKKLMFLFTLLLGCASHTKDYTIEHPGHKVWGGYSENGLGSTHEWAEVKSELPAAGYGYSGLQPGLMDFPSAAPATWVMPGTVLPGSRRMEHVSGGPVVLVPAENFASKDDFKVLVESDLDQDRRLNKIENNE